MPFVSALVFGSLLLAPPAKGAPAKPMVPAEWQARYNKVMASVNKLDFNGYMNWFDKSFVSKGPDGKTMNYAAYKTMMQGTFAKTKQITMSVKVNSVKASGKNMAVSFQLAGFKLSKDNKRFAITEVGVDTWKKVGNDWKCVMTVDSIFSERPGPTMKAHAEAHRNH